jgi:hypothetical protein
MMVLILDALGFLATDSESLVNSITETYSNDKSLSKSKNILTIGSRKKILLEGCAHQWVGHYFAMVSSYSAGSDGCFLGRVGCVSATFVRIKGHLDFILDPRRFWPLDIEHYRIVRDDGYDILFL